MAKSPEAIKRIKYSLEVILPKIDEKIWVKHDFRKKDKMLKRLYIMMKEVYREVHMPCKNVTDIAKLIIAILHLCGTSAKLHLEPIKKL